MRPPWARRSCRHLSSPAIRTCSAPTSSPARSPARSTACIATATARKSWVIARCCPVSRASTARGATSAWERRKPLNGCRPRASHCRRFAPRLISPTGAKPPDRAPPNRSSQAFLVPKLISTIPGYNREQFFADATAGVIVGIVAVPLAIAFAIASGVTPDRGLWTAIVAGFIVSALGGSRVQIGGPTGAFVVIVYGIVQKYGIDGLTVATFMAGILLVIMGLAKLGAVIKFIPHPVITGFTSGIAVIIFSSQVKDLFGLHMGIVPAEFLSKWGAYAEHAGVYNPYAIGIAALTLAIIIGWQWLHT